MHSHPRRRFLLGSAFAASAAGLGLAGGPARLLFAATPAAAPLLTRPIPSSGQRLAVIGAGTSGSYDVEWDTPEYAQLQEVVKRFFDGGGRLIDTAPNYGRSDVVLGRLLADGDWRERCFLATKIAADSVQDAQAQWAQSLRRLRTDRVELLQVHNLRHWRRQLPYARELQAQGGTKYVGVTHYTDAGLPELERVLRSEKLDFVQIHYSVNSPGAAKTVLPLARDKGVAVIVNRAFDDGRLFAQVKDAPLPAWATEAGVGSWAQMFLKFAISHPAVTVVIPATGKPERQTDQLKAGTGPLLSQAQQQELMRRFAG
ncbi:aldo/keto reductase [Pseudoxanthomonas broegbernensis]|uniref:Aldo/keto reductase n=1 Tax=Pseudoxanthomonas broegbernensis TaxID=83619 RepID=A0A7V8K6C9_9GAMM|nr:aldo/keto reductase [Pseudoxanthomonas broegbernensis]KAF1685704.1 aldo/keto reductase [Pseudoxanthomonas broegbernensis]MBB6066050.1 aryl-alcohol dehydrogenase-like predicted oxidoreductase [Pseudoxanthomonas broegbernensis]